MEVIFQALSVIGVMILSVNFARKLVILRRKRGRFAHAVDLSRGTRQKTQQKMF